MFSYFYETIYVMINLNLIKRAVRTDKTVILRTNYNQYTFDVDVQLTKQQIKTIFKNLYDVDIVSVNTYILPLKKKRSSFGLKYGYKSHYKRAIIKIKQGQQLILK